MSRIANPGNLKNISGDTIMNDKPEWVREFPGAVTICDVEGRILEMNARAEEIFASDGGAALVGKNVLDCHPEPSRSKLEGMLREGRTNVYTIAKNGKKKLIFQAPWFKNGVYSGFVELGLEIPDPLPHFER
jgi:transcriptional regulator with PAS, ATPase and Fis domain